MSVGPMRGAAASILVASAVACGPGASRAPTPPSPPPSSSPTSSQPSPKPSAHAPSSPREPCILVGEDPEPVEVEGTLRAAEGGRAFVLRLADARCAVGLARASVVVEVMVVSDGFDLRPLVDRRVRVLGVALADASTLEGPGVIVVAHMIERLPARPAPDDAP